MRIALIAVLLIGCTLGAPTSSPRQSSIVATPTGSPCPAALHAGFLVELDGELVTDPDGIPGGPVGRLIWQPWEYRVRADGDVLVVEGASGDVKAREGDYVRLGGGMNATDDTFIVCGAFEVSEAPPPTGPAQSSAANRAEAACMATRDDIPLVIVESGTATLAAAYEVTGAQLTSYDASAFGPADPWEDDEVVQMCFFDGDFTTMTPGPPQADRSAVRVLVVISDDEALLWSVARKDPSALPITNPATMSEASAGPQAWGPLAVARAKGGDTARTEGTLVITDTCVFLERGGTRQLLVWPMERTTWNKGPGSVSFQTLDGKVVTVRSGDRVVLGGGGWGEAEDGLMPHEWVATLDWAAQPAPHCVTKQKFFVSHIEL